MKWPLTSNCIPWFLTWPKLKLDRIRNRHSQKFMSGSKINIDWFSKEKIRAIFAMLLLTTTGNIWSCLHKKNKKINSHLPNIKFLQIWLTDCFNLTTLKTGQFISNLRCQSEESISTKEKSLILHPLSILETKRSPTEFSTQCLPNMSLQKNKLTSLKMERFLLKVLKERVSLIPQIQFWMPMVSQ